MVKSNKQVVISGGLKQQFLKLKLLIMKKLQSLGRSLSKNEQKRISGGQEEFAQCRAICHCSPTCQTTGICNVSPCSAQDDVGVQCGGTYYTCSQICYLGGCNS